MSEINKMSKIGERQAEIEPTEEKLKGVRIIDYKKIVVIGAGAGSEILSQEKIKMLLESRAEHVIIVSDNVRNNEIAELNNFFNEGDITVIPYYTMDLKTIKDLETKDILEFKAIDEIKEENFEYKYESFEYKYEIEKQESCFDGIRTSGKSRKQNNAKLAKRKPKSKKTHRRK